MYKEVYEISDMYNKVHEISDMFITKLLNFTYGIFKKS